MSICCVASQQPGASFQLTEKQGKWLRVALSVASFMVGAGAIIFASLGLAGLMGFNSGIVTSLGVSGAIFSSVGLISFLEIIFSYFRQEKISIHQDSGENESMFIEHYTSFRDESMNTSVADISQVIKEKKELTGDQKRWVISQIYGALLSDNAERLLELLPLNVVELKNLLDDANAYYAKKCIEALKTYQSPRSPVKDIPIGTLELSKAQPPEAQCIMAVMRHDLERCKEILPQINPNNCMGDNLLQVALTFGSDAIACHVASDPRFNVNHQTRSDHKSLLHIALSKVEVVRALLARSEIQVNIRDAKGNTPLHLACSNGYEETIQELLNRTDIDRTLTNTEGKTAHALASEELQALFV